MISPQLRIQLKGLLGTMLWPFPTRLASRCFIRKDQGLVLTFHYIGRPILKGVGEDLFISPLEFRRVLDFIAERLTPLPPRVFLKRLREGTLPERATLVTFDDCPHETVAIALPELLKRGLSACFFVSPGLIADGRTVPSAELMSLCAQAPRGVHEIRLESGETIHAPIHNAESRAALYRRVWPELLRCSSRKHSAFLGRMRADLGVDSDLRPRLPLADWHTLAALDSSGMLIGNHTMLHSTITADGEGQFEADVALAYDLIERHFGPQPRVFCYPYGRKADQDHGAEAVLQRLGTDFAFVTQGGIARPKRYGCLNLHREDASYSANATKLAPLLAFFR